MIRHLAAALLGILAATCAFAQDRVVHVYNWTDYVDPKVLERFTAETGIRVVYDTYDTNEIVETKLLAGKSGYDVVVPSGPFIQRLIRASVFQKLDRSKLPNLRHAWPEIQARLAAYDPGNCLRRELHVGHDRDRREPRQGEGAARRCAAGQLEPPSRPGAFGQAEGLRNPRPGRSGGHASRRAQGARPRSRFQEAGGPSEGGGRAHEGARQHPQVPLLEYINALANGDICMAVGYSGDILQARKRAIEAKNGVDIGYVIPREGALMWFDAMAIPADAPHPAEAHAFIDFMLRPDIAAANTDFLSYANGNLAAKDLIRPEIASTRESTPTLRHSLGS
jgi:putrescine transport system substrate-binding protein